MTLSQMPPTLCNTHTYTYTPPPLSRELFLWCDSSLNLSPNILGASNPEKPPRLLSYLTHPDEREYTHTLQHTPPEMTPPLPPVWQQQTYAYRLSSWSHTYKSDVEVCVLCVSLIHSVSDSEVHTQYTYILTFILVCFVGVWKSSLSICVVCLFFSFRNKWLNFCHLCCLVINGFTDFRPTLKVNKQKIKNLS